MYEKIYANPTEETREEKEYYRPYHELIHKIDVLSGMQSPPAKKYLPLLEPLDEVAIDVVGNIQNQLDELDRGSENITIDLWECIPEILGYHCNLEDGTCSQRPYILLARR